MDTPIWFFFADKNELCEVGKFFSICIGEALKNVRLLWRLLLVAVFHAFFIYYFKENWWVIQHNWWQHDEATSFTANVSLNVIHEALAGRVVSRNYDIPWPPQLTDLSHCYFFYGETSSPNRIVANHTVFQSGKMSFKVKLQ